jgi:hypothetical protein
LPDIWTINDEDEATKIAAEEIRYYLASGKDMDLSLSKDIGQLFKLATHYEMECLKVSL